MTQKIDREKIIGKKFERTFALESRAAKVDTESRTAELAFSSETPIYHWFGFLILDHQKESVRLDRLNSAGALLWNHRADNFLGGIEQAGIADDRKGRATVKFSQSQAGIDAMNNVDDGLLKSVSVGFCVYDLEPEPGPDGKQKEIDGIYVYRSRDWEPFEISLVSIPADTTVGINRALDTDEGESLVEEESCPECGGDGCEVCAGEDDTRNLKFKKPAPIKRDKSNTKEKTQMADENNNNNQPAQVETRSAELTAAQEIRNFGELLDETEMARDYIASGKSVVEFRTAVAEKRAKSTPVPNKPLVELTDKEEKEYSIARAILADANIRDGKNFNSFEVEVSQELERKVNAPGIEFRGGILVPTNVQIKKLDRAAMLARIEMLERAGLDTKTTAAGGAAVFTEFGGSMIELLRNRAMIMALGATMLPGLQGNVSFPRQAGAGTATWVGENPGADVGESNLTLNNVTLTPKTLQSTTSYSRQLLAQSSINVDGIVSDDLAQITALALDVAAIHGTGASNQPTGIYAAAGTNAVAFGGTVTFAKLVDMESALANVNADLGNMAYLTTPTVRGKAKQTQEFAGTNGLAVWRDGEMNGYRAEASNQVSKVMLASAATGGTESGIIFANWAELLFGDWGVFEVITDPYRLKKQGMIEVTTFQLVDIQMRHAESFCKGTGLVP